MDPSNLTPIRQTRAPSISISRDSEPQDEPAASDTTAAAGNSEEALRAQLLEMKSQMDAMQQQLHANRRIVEASVSTQSREYWTFPTPETIVYPGENASRPAQAAYIHPTAACIPEQIATYMGSSYWQVPVPSEF